MTDFKLSTQPISLELISQMELINVEKKPLPGSYTRRKELDPRLSGLSSLNTKESDEVVLYEHVATIKMGNDLYIAFRETMDCLLNRQDDTNRFPEWLMKSDLKKAELKIHLSKVLRRPADKYDNGWLEFIDNDMLFNSICYFLVQRKVLGPEVLKES